MNHLRRSNDDASLTRRLTYTRAHTPSIFYYRTSPGLFLRRPGRFRQNFLSGATATTSAECGTTTVKGVRLAVTGVQSFRVAVARL